MAMKLFIASDRNKPDKADFACATFIAFSNLLASDKNLPAIRQWFSNIVSHI